MKPNFFRAHARVYPMSERFIVGSLVRVKSKLSSDEKKVGCGWAETMNDCLGCIGIIYEKDRNCRLFLASRPSQTYYWSVTWLDAVTPEDEAKLDAVWLKNLRDTCAAKYPQTHPEEQEIVQTKKRVRAELTKIEGVLAAIRARLEEA